MLRNTKLRPRRLRWNGKVDTLVLSKNFNTSAEIRRLCYYLFSNLVERYSISHWIPCWDSMFGIPCYTCRKKSQISWIPCLHLSKKIPNELDSMFTPVEKNPKPTGFHVLKCRNKSQISGFHLKTWNPRDSMYRSWTPLRDHLIPKEQSEISVRSFRINV